MRSVNTIVIHASATPPSMNVDREDIWKWHVEERGFDDVGYHYIILRSGQIQAGRKPEIPGAHVRGHNSNSIGVCLIGGVNEQGDPDCNYTAAQWQQAERLVRSLAADYDADVVGHRDLDPSKDCPCFDAKAWATDWNASKRRD